MKDAARKLAFWLLPAAPARDFFRAVVDDLAARYEAPAFEPHLTLCAGSLDDAFRFAALDELQMPAFVELEIDAIQHSDKYTKTLFVRLREQAELSELRRAVPQAIGAKDDGGDFDPHLSLIYKTMPAEQRRELADNIQLPFEHVRFDRMKAVSTPATIEAAEGVYSWRTLWERPLQR